MANQALPSHVRFADNCHTSPSSLDHRLAKIGPDSFKQTLRGTDKLAKAAAFELYTRVRHASSRHVTFSDAIEAKEQTLDMLAHYPGDINEIKHGHNLKPDISSVHSSKNILTCRRYDMNGIERKSITFLASADGRSHMHKESAMVSLPACSDFGVADYHPRQHGLALIEAAQYELFSSSNIHKALGPFALKLSEARRRTRRAFAECKRQVRFADPYEAGFRSTCTVTISVPADCTPGTVTDFRPHKAGLNLIEAAQYERYSTRSLGRKFKRMAGRKSTAARVQSQFTTAHSIVVGGCSEITPPGLPARIRATVRTFFHVKPKRVLMLPTKRRFSSE